MKTYEIVPVEYVEEKTYVIRSEDSETGEVWFIPVDESNADFRKYLEDTNGGLPLPKETK